MATRLQEEHRAAVEAMEYVALRWIKEGYEHSLGTHGPVASGDSIQSQARDYLPIIDAELDSARRRTECREYVLRHGHLPPCVECERKQVDHEHHRSFVDATSALLDRLNRWID